MKRTKGGVTQNEVAERCGVSRVAVSLALQGSSRISAETKKRILQVAEEMGYTLSSNDEARRLVMRRYGTEPVNHAILALLPLEFMRMEYYRRLFTGLSDVLSRSGFGLLTYHIDPDSEKALIENLMPLVNKGFIDGAVLFSPSDSSQMVTSLRSSPGFFEKPIISLAKAFASCSDIRADEEHGAYLAAKHLISLGHKVLAHGIYPDTHQGKFRPIHRLDGVRRALSEAGLSPEENLKFLPFYGDWHNPIDALVRIRDLSLLIKERQEATRMVLRFLRSNQTVTAIMAINDTYAINVYSALAGTEYSVPDNISLIGFDGTEVLSGTEGMNLLSTVQLPLVEMGCEAARLLIRQIAGESSGYQSVVLKPEFMDRSTVQVVRQDP